MPTGADGVLTATWRPEAAAVSLEVDGAGWGSGSFTNLATNPSFEATSGTVEVRRNLASDPLATVAGGIPAGQARWTARWFGGSGGAGTTTAITGASDGPLPGVSTYLRKAWTVAGGVSETGFDHTIGAYSSPATFTAGMPVAVGRTYTLSSYMRASSVPTGVQATTFSMRAVFRDAAGARILPAPVATSVTPVAGQWVRVSLTVTAPTGAVTASIGSDVSGAGTWPVGATLDGTALLIEESPTPGAFFAPGLPSPDSDLTPSWTGTANASASILTAALVDGSSNTGGRIGFSSQAWSSSGSRSIRVLPRAVNNDTFVSVHPMIPSAAVMAGKTYTVLGKVRLAEAQAGTLHPNARAFRAAILPGDAPVAFTYLRSAPNEPGVHEVRATFTVPANASGWVNFRLYNGAAEGNGDVWWDDLAIIEGVYTGPWFDGSNAPASRPDAVVAWTGTPNASTSTATIPAITDVRIDRRVAGEPVVPVRGADRVPAVGGYWVGSDHEMPLGSSIAYQAIGYTAAGAQVLSSMVTVSTEGAPHGIWLKVAGRPNLSVCTVGRAVDGPTSETQGGVYDIAGGFGVAVASASGINADRLTLTIGSVDTVQEQSIRAVLSAHRVLLIQDCGHDVVPSGWYFVSSVSRAPRDPLYLLPGRVHTLTLTRTGIPAGAGQGVIGWSWDAVAATYATWDAVEAAYASWFDLERGA